MTTPGEPVVPKNTKAWVATIGGLLGALVPLLAQLAGVLPAPYGAIVSGVVALIGLVTGRATYQVPNVPKGTIAILPTPSAPAGSGWPEP